MKEGIIQIANFVYEYLMKTGEKYSDDPWGPRYRWEHTLRVSYWARRLAIDEGADFEKCVVAALFHDVSHFASEDYRQHGVKSAEIAKDFLVKQTTPKISLRMLLMLSKVMSESLAQELSKPRSFRMPTL